MDLFWKDGEDVNGDYWHLREVPEHRSAALALAKRFAVAADADFASDFPTSTLQRLWEMSLFCALADEGLTPTSPSQLGLCHEGGPDVVVDGDGVRCFIECIAPTPGDGPNRVRPRDGSGLGPVTRPEVDLRLTSAVKTKADVIDRYRQKGLVDEDAAAVVAINMAGVDWGANLTDHLGMPTFVRLAYGLDNYEVHFHLDDGHMVDDGAKWSTRIAIPRKNKQGEPADVGTAFFLDPGYAHVGALIGAMRGAGSVERVGGGDLVVVHNPHATRPLPRGYFAFGREYFLDAHDDVTADTWRFNFVDHSDG